MSCDGTMASGFDNGSPETSVISRPSRKIDGGVTGGSEGPGRSRIGVEGGCSLVGKMDEPRVTP